ncbi:MAG: hypothetical protein U1F08_14545 [Steroidobacteraceae bacterium]
MRDRSMLILAAALLAVYAALWHWQSPGAGGRMSRADVDAYVERLRGHLPATPEDEAQFLGRIRAWGYADDGKPVYMLNVLRFYAQLKSVPHGEAVVGPPEAANATYEKNIVGLLFKLGGYPLFSGTNAGPDRDGIVDPAHALDGVDHVLVVRYPSRRAFLDLISDPRYIPWAPWKMAAVELGLLPLRSTIMVPDPRIVAGGLFLVVFLAVGWWRSARRRAL